MTLAISAKDLGQLALPGFCSRCFWIRRRAKTLPYQVFPGIFSSIDSYSKKFIHGHFDRGLPPDWLQPLGPLDGYLTPPHWSKFRVHDEHSNVTLQGVPDAIYHRTHGSFVIADYKTATFTPHQDELLPMYEVQLNAYAFIGQNCGIDPVAGLALIYTEPLTDAADAARAENDRTDGFAMHFCARLHEVELNVNRIPMLLAEVRQIEEQTLPPDGRAGCKNCEKVDKLVSILAPS